LDTRKHPQQPHNSVFQQKRKEPFGPLKKNTIACDKIHEMLLAKIRECFNAHGFAYI
jgi:hypothetical protein